MLLLIIVRGGRVHHKMILSQITEYRVMTFLRYIWLWDFVQRWLNSIINLLFKESVLIDKRHIRLMNHLLIIILKVLVKNYELVILLYEISEAKVLGEKSSQFNGRSIISHFSWVNIFILNHKVKQLSSLSSSLHTLMHIEIKNAIRWDLKHVTDSISDKKPLIAHFENAYTFVTDSLNVQSLIVSNKFTWWGNCVRKLLSLYSVKRISWYLQLQTLFP